MKILLASQSSRRKELLSQMGFSFQTVTVNCDEVFPKEMAVEEIAGYLSNLKAESFRNLASDEVLITADTVVVFEDSVLGKPSNSNEAKEMLLKLSGKTHQVYTGITLKTSEKKITDTDVAYVTFSKISLEEANFYIEKYKPFDKAGSYGIQEWIGMTKICKIEGSFYTVMGLPTHLVYTLLKELKKR